MKQIERVTSSYTIVVHSSPNMVKEVHGVEEVTVSEYFHWHIEILPKDFRSSKYKREDEFYTISTLPEEAAALLRQD
jgi:galactose-1-phosphate uridylyltransferase